MSRADYYDAQLTRPIPDGVLTVTQTPGGTPSSVTQHFQMQGVGADLIDPDARSSYVDELVGGFEWEAFPNYTNGGEIPLTPRGQGFQTVDGFRRRTPFEYDTSLHLDYGFRFGNHRIVLLADEFNLFDQQRTIDYDNWSELELGVANPDFGKPVSQNVAGPQFQTPRQIRFGARFEF